MFPMILLILKFLNMGITNSCTGFTDLMYRVHRQKVQGQQRGTCVNYSQQKIQNQYIYIP